MLDLDHPMTDHIFAASALEDGLMLRCQRMTLVPSKERVALLRECDDILEKMRRLNDEHFEASPFIREAIDEAQHALEELAHANGGQVTQDKSEGEGSCAVCGEALMKFETFPGRAWSRWIILCRHCNEPFMKAKAKLESPEGFGTCFI